MEHASRAFPWFGGRVKFFIGGILIIAAIVFLIISSTKANALYYYTIDELLSRGPGIVNQPVRILGAVIGDSIQYDPQTLSLQFTIANIPADTKQIEVQGGLSMVLHKAVKDTSHTRLQVTYQGPKPDLLRDEAQAVMTGYIDENGVFQANELLLKCPTKYEAAAPSQVAP
jgi:cytochrome c-type biogenesis protein CcmE